MAVRLPDNFNKMLALIERHECSIIDLRGKLVSAYQGLSKKEQRRIKRELSKHVWLPCDCFADDGLHKPSCPRSFTR